VYTIYADQGGTIEEKWAEIIREYDEYYSQEDDDEQ
jgi:hypothetical protein